MFNSQQKNLREIRKVWLVQWGFRGVNEDKYLKQLGIKEKVVDVISVREKFNRIIDIAKSIYIRNILSFSEKVYFANYSKGEKRKKEFFGHTVPVFTHYQSDLYKNLIKAISKKGFNDPLVKDLSNKWNKYPQYIIIGHNPYLEVIKVFDLSVYKNKNGKEIIEWSRPLVDGNFKKEKYEFKN